MLETSTRLLSLLSLLQSRRHWSGSELAERLEVGPRTVRRDVDRLRRLGYPIDGAPGVDGGYRLAAGASLPPLLLDDEEAVAIAVGLRSAVTGGVAGIGETSVRALSKLEQLLPERVRRRVNALAAATVPYPAPGWAGSDSAPEVLLGIATACRDHERLRFGYRSHGDEHSRRHVEPHALVHTGRRWYLVAWDVDRADWRTFRVDRIDRPPSPQRRFDPRPPPADDLAAYVARRVAAARDRVEAEVILHAPHDDVAARVPYWAGALQPLGPDRCRLRTATDWLDRLAVHIAVIGVEFEVVSPPELTERIAQVGERLQRAARRSAADATASPSSRRRS